MQYLKVDDGMANVNTALFDSDTAEVVDSQREDRHSQQVPQRRTQAAQAPTDLDVCFKAKAHPGTERWRKTVETFAKDYDAYPRWDDKIKDEVKHRLEQEDIRRYFVSLDSEGKQVSIGEGSWCIAVEDEILQKTKQRFLDYRKPPKGKSPTGKKHGPERPRKTRTEDDSSSGFNSLAPSPPDGSTTNLDSVREDLDQVIKRLRTCLALDRQTQLPVAIPLLSQLVDMTQTLQRDLQAAIIKLEESDHDNRINTTDN